MGQTFDFMGEVEDGWCWGRISGRMGVFPSNFVEMISEEVVVLWPGLYTCTPGVIEYTWSKRPDRVGTPPHET